MSALEQLAQAILDGRVALIPHRDWDGQLIEVSIHVEPATEAEPPDRVSAGVGPGATT